jgi:hypothetical protein
VDVSRELLLSPVFEPDRVDEPGELVMLGQELQERPFLVVDNMFPDQVAEFIHAENDLLGRPVFPLCFLECPERKKQGRADDPRRQHRDKCGDLQPCGNLHDLSLFPGDSYCCRFDVFQAVRFDEMHEIGWTPGAFEVFSDHPPRLVLQVE